MAEILSRSEVELLLSALDGKPSAPADVSAAPLQGATFGGLDSGASGSERTSELARAAVEFCESFRLALQATLQHVLPPATVLRRHMPARLSLQEFLQNSADRPVWFVLETERTPGDLLLAADRNFLVHLLFRLLGAETKPETDDLTRPWTELELRLWRRLLQHACENLPPSVQWSLSGVEVVEALSEFSTWNAQSPWWVERWELRDGELRGGLQFTVSWGELASRSRDPRLRQDAAQVPENPPNTGELIAELACVEVTPDELAELKPGDVIVTDRGPDDPIRLLIDGKEVYTARPGLHHGRKAVRLVSKVDGGKIEQPNQ